MCGILLFKGNEKITSRFHDNLEKLSHRGPDFKNFIHLNDIYIGHTRLSIIDLSDMGNQPMVSTCSNYILSFNGEIYNYKDLKAELIKLGYEFKTKTDSEVLLNGFIEYGEDILNKVEGIFAFIIYDILKDKIFFARDHFGVKPIYYFNFESNLIISSEIKSFKEFTNIDYKSKILFLSHGYIPSPHTYLKEVKSLLPGSVGCFVNNKLTTKKYFSSLNLIKNYKIDFNKDLITQSVKSQMISDAKLGCFFSGGLDSSILTLESFKLNRKIETYSINFKNSQDESEFQMQLKERYNFNNISKELTLDDFRSNLNEFLKFMDSPTIDGLNTFFVSSIAKNQKTKVALSGLGSDEIFLGYPIYNNFKFLYTLQKLISFLPLNFINTKYKKLDYLKLYNDYGVYLSQRGIFSISEIATILNSSNSEIINYLKSNLSFDKKINELSQLERMIYFEINKYMEGQLLRNTDVFGMANSIEIRVPFLDLELAAHVLSINKKGFNNKKILINSYKNDIPEKVLNRKKMGFELPYQSWLKELGAYDKQIKKYKRLNLNNDSHWSKIWTLEILDFKYK